MSLMIDFNEDSGAGQDLVFKRMRLHVCLCLVGDACLHEPWSHEPANFSFATFSPARAFF